jgi:hypothetical protein
MSMSTLVMKAWVIYSDNNIDVYVEKHSIRWTLASFGYITQLYYVTMLHPYHPYSPLLRCSIINVRPRHRYLTCNVHFGRRLQP